MFYNKIGDNMRINDTIFYKIIRPLVTLYIKLFYQPIVIGLENIPKTGKVVLAGNHTKWLDPVMLVGITKRQIHFLTKQIKWDLQLHIYLII